MLPHYLLNDTHRCDHSSSRLCSTSLLHKPKLSTGTGRNTIQTPIRHVSHTTAQPQPVHQTSSSPSSCTPVKTIILHRTCAVAVNNTESAEGELVILLTLSLNRSLSLPSVTQFCLATEAEQFKWQQRPGLA